MTSFITCYKVFYKVTLLVINYAENKRRHMIDKQYARTHTRARTHIHTHTRTHTHTHTHTHIYVHKKQECLN